MIRWIDNKSERWATDRIYKPWKELIEPKWHPRLEEKFTLSSSIYGNNNIDIYFVYDDISLLITKVGHIGNESATVMLNDILFNLKNEEIDVSDLNFYMIEEEDGNLDPDVEYGALFPAQEE